MKTKVPDSGTVGVFLGRISPLHKGHQAVIDKMISDFGIKNCLVIIGSSNSYNERTPYTFNERKKIVKTIYPSLKVIGLPDVNPEIENFEIKTLKLWLKNLKNLERKMHTKFIFYGGSPKDVSYLKKDFKTYVCVNRNSSKDKISATDIRIALRNHNIKKLQRYLHPRIIRLAVKGYLNFTDTSGLVQKYTDNWNPEETQPLKNLSTKDQVGILGIPDNKALAKIKSVIKILKKADSNQIYYDGNELHLTFIGRVDPGLVTPLKFPKIEKTFKKYNLTFKLKGFYGNKSGLYLLCIPKFDIPSLRNNLRKIVKSHGKNFDEMAEKVGWICILRYAKKPTRKFFDFINKNKYKDFGDLTLDKTQIYRFNNILFKKDKNTVKLFEFPIKK